jgi:hypothetical protein
MEISKGNFHQLVLGVQEAAGDRLEGINLQHIQYYHNVRNKLYHDGDGITVPKHKTFEYGNLAVDLLNRLLDVDITNNLIIDEETDLNTKFPELITIKENVTKELKIFDQKVELMLELISPKLLLPGFTQSFEKLVDEYDSEWQDEDHWIGSKLDYLVFREEFINKVVVLIDKVIENTVYKESLLEINEYFGFPPVLTYKTEKVVSDIFPVKIRPSIRDIYLRIIQILVKEGKYNIIGDYYEWENYPESYFDLLNDLDDYRHFEREIIDEIRSWVIKIDVWLMKNR